MGIELAVFSEWEKALTLYGWLLNNFFTEILFSSGVVLLVMIITLVSVWSQTAATKHVSQTMQKKLEMRLLVIVPVVLFAFFPIFKIDQIQVLDLAGDCQEYGKHIAFEPIFVGDDLKQKLITETAGVKIPLLWALIHKISSGIYYQVFDGLDCFTDWRAIETIIRTNKIQDPALADEYHRFILKCYGQARYQYQKVGHQGGGTPPLSDDLAYLGSSYYLNTPGYYNAFLLPTQLHRWQPNTVRSCATWWQGDANNKGLRELLLNQATNPLPSLEANQILNPGTRDLEDRIIKAMLKSNSAEWIPPATNGTPPNPADGLNVPGSGLSGLSEQVSATFNHAYFVKKITSYAQPIILLALYFFIPLFLLVSGLNLMGVLYYVSLMVGIQAMPMVYVLVSALDAKVTESLYQNIGLFNVNMDRLIIARVFSYLPLVLAVAYIAASMLAIKKSISSHAIH